MADNFQHLKQKAYALFIVVALAYVAAVVASWWIIFTYFKVETQIGILLLAVISILVLLFMSRILISRMLSPIEAIWKAVLHVGRQGSSFPAPDMNDVHLSRDFTEGIITQIYRYAGQIDGEALAHHRNTMIQAVSVVSNFPLPVFVLNKELRVTNASDSALLYLALESSQLFGHELLNQFDLIYPGDKTLESWIADCQQHQEADQAYWQRVKLKLHDGKTVKQCDIAAYFNPGNENGTEFIVTFFDHTEIYGQDDQSLSFVALAVHELRTPLTMLRGYIEVFDDELSGKLEPELASYLQKLQVSANQLSSFVSNVLNVVKLEQNQLQLNLSKCNWKDVLDDASEAMKIRAEALDLKMSFDIAHELPPVAADPVSISLVVNNLLDNAIKYSRTSHDSREIIIKASLNKEGMVETSIQDYGVGIPANVLPNLFEKFYRNHHTRTKIGGTGLGLYLSKSIVNAHGGNIWVKSKMDEGSTFTFTLSPYSKETSANDDTTNQITRHPHGWIKNHSLHRR